MAYHARRLCLLPSSPMAGTAPRLRLPAPAVLVLLHGRTAAAAAVASTGPSSPLVLARSHPLHLRGGGGGGGFDAGSASFSSSTVGPRPHPSPLPPPRALLHELLSRLLEEDEDGRRKMRFGDGASPITTGEGRMRRYRVVGGGDDVDPHHGGLSDAYDGAGATNHPRRPMDDVASDLIRSYLSMPAPDYGDDSDVESFLTDLVLGSSSFSSSSSAKDDGWLDEVDEAVRTYHATTLSTLDDEEGEVDENEDDLVHEGRKLMRIRALRGACVTPHEMLISTVLDEAAGVDGDGAALGLTWLIRLREDLLGCLGRRRQRRSSMEDDIEARGAEEVVTSRMRRMDEDLRLMLSERFSPRMLELRRITYEQTPAAIIEAVARKEGVHPLRSLSDLKTRLGPSRRCFALFHPTLPDEPLAFIHVALLPEIADSMDAIDRLTAATAPPSSGIDPDGRPPPPTVAVFYSINSTRAGLGGVELGSLLIKRAVNVLRAEFPSSLDTFVTLSPIPRFRAWLQERVLRFVAFASDEVESSESEGFEADISTLLSPDDVKVLSRALVREGDDRAGRLDGDDVVVILERLLDVLDDPSWCDDGAVASAIRTVLMRLAARYLVLERDGRGRPLDGVARFHVRNGAEMYRLNYLADRSRRGMLNSAGIMINYRYDLDTLEENRSLYKSDGIIPIREGVADWLCAGSETD